MLKNIFLVNKNSLEWQDGQPDNFNGKEHCLQVQQMFKCEFSIKSYTNLNILYVVKPNIEKQTEYEIRICLYNFPNNLNTGCSI